MSMLTYSPAQDKRPYTPKPKISNLLSRPKSASEHQTYTLALQTSSLHLPILLSAHHSALLLIHNSSFFSSGRFLSERQYLKSLNLREQSLGVPVR